MKYLILVITLLFSSIIFAKDHFSKDIFEMRTEAQKQVIGSMANKTAKGKFISFKVSGVVMLIGRAEFLTNDNEIISITVPYAKFNAIELFRNTEISYIKYDSFISNENEFYDAAI